MSSSDSNQDQLRINYEKQIQHMKCADVKKEFIECKLQLSDNCLVQSMNEMKNTHNQLVLDYDKLKNELKDAKSQLEKNDYYNDLVELKKEYEKLEKDRDHYKTHFREDIRPLQMYASWADTKIRSCVDQLWMLHNMLQNRCQETKCEEACRVQIQFIIPMLLFVASTDPLVEHDFYDNQTNLPDSEDDDYGFCMHF